MFHRRIMDIEMMMAAHKRFICSQWLSHFCGYHSSLLNHDDEGVGEERKDKLEEMGEEGERYQHGHFV